ncbi:hypothetical protein [Chamaesiphon sp. GL140_3_metabinner_50]|uniref:hypothetical protein n=1 Tax=Chamaesiphon sp. GL140_3_metabinner_50 TaxID=2970812 RepID=UPI0025EAE8C2|nr:hypothetical protein [Chamaesiphon sp. GL140_3_metabinner_50]
MNKPTSTRVSSWQPHSEIKSHSGSPLTVDADFFMPPPPTIGELISADTTLKTSTSNSMSTAARCTITLLVAVAVFILILLLFHEAIAALITSGILSFLTWNSTQFNHTCSYVGTKGLISHKLLASRSAMPKESLLLFTDAHSLYAKTIRNYTNGFYTSTTYTYTWKKNSGNEYVITGGYQSEKNPPKDGDNWHFANTSESVWSSYLLSTLDAQIDRDGFVEFSMGGALQAVRVGPGFMEFVTRKDGSQRVMVADMRDISLGSGTFQFKHQDARWWSGKGKYSFEYANIPNARVFLICLSELAGISWD